MANYFTPITKYLPKSLDTVFAEESKTLDLLDAGKMVNVNFSEAGYVKVLSILTDGLSDYYRVNEGSTGNAYVHKQGTSGDGYRKGNVSTSWEIFKLHYDRGIQFQVDNMSNEEEAGAVIGNTLTEFLRTRVVPEVDAVRFSRIAEKCSASLGNLVTETPTASSILANFYTAFEWLKARGVPEAEQIIYVNPSVMTKIQTSDKLVRYLTQEEYKRGDITFTIQKFEGRKIIVVTPDRFFTKVQVGDNGFYPSASSKLINYMIVSARACVPIVKLEKSQVWTPDQVQDFDGYKVNFRMLHDLIIPKNKVIGCYCSVSSTDADTIANSLDVLLEEGTTTNGFVATAFYSQPAGINGELVYSASAFTLNSQVTVDGSTIISVPLDTQIIDATNTSAYFALIDASGVVVAATPSAITLVKKGA